jgi:hypothetical protein
MARDGVRVPKDDKLADAIVAASCSQGGIESCLAWALWHRDAAPRDAAPLAMRACAGNDAATGVLGCAFWMELLEGNAIDPSQSERIGGLRQACGREQRGSLQPEAPLHTCGATIVYRAGACGRLKDMGTSAP